ncbi:DUF3150 domain-containing protein [Pseudomonas sp. DP-17]|uniref:DUF3150 domain-containing protein n=1 Tax=Pseudomonas sp. DP-17 TaxID=1580486 RepID=UPI001EFB1A90|nr:DUF3150 domain-containing protein [Pseudomonas sp. DP-17]MCG8910994.1 DUF3150 domain-containing protein [Pseudomonas sp. DP-17]
MAIQPNEIKILQQLLLVDLSDIHLWTARKKLQPSMFEGKVPPETLASLGSMRVIDPEVLKPFEKLKRKATAVLETHGVKFLGGYAVSQDRIQEVIAELERLKDEFYTAKTWFISNYDHLVKRWIDKGWDKEEWRNAIQASVTPKAKVEEGMQFGYAACRVAPDGDTHLSDTLGKQVRGLSDQLYAETADTALRLLETGLATRGQVTQVTLNTVRKISTKLRGLMFLSSDVKVLTDHIEEVLASLPQAGPVSGVEYNTVVTLVSSLSDEDSIRRLVKNLNLAQGNAGAPALQVTSTAPCDADRVEPKQVQLAELFSAAASAEQEPADLLFPVDAPAPAVAEIPSPTPATPAPVEVAPQPIPQNFWF